MKNIGWLLIFMVTAIAVGCDPNKTVPSETGLSECIRDQKTETAQVIRVIDGDTIEVKLNGKTERVRYLMVDTPEKTANDPIPGRRASEYNQMMVDGKTVILVRDINDRDDFGRLLRFVTVDGVSVNYELVKQGYATTFIRPPDVLCSGEMQLAMLTAFKARIGIWHSIPVTVNNSGHECPEGCKQPETGCEIKGNINNQGDKIFHLPGSDDYAGVEISSKSGERWFCTIDEAITNGWRPPRAE